MEVSSEKEENLSHESGSEGEMLLNMRRKVASGDDESDECMSDDSRVSELESDDQSGKTEYYDDDNNDDDDDELVEEEEREYCSQEAYSESKLVEEVCKDGEVAALHMDVSRVPTSGDFYMHDDRSSQRGQNVWETKDYQKWKHDKFEEINSQRPPSGELSALVDTLPVGSMGKRNSGSHSNYGDTTPAYSGIRGPKVDADYRIVKGRGPVRYKPAVKEDYGRSVTGRVPIRARISGPNNFSGRESTLIYGAEFGTVAPRNYSYTSRMSHVRHPSYPSHSFNEDISKDQTRDVSVRKIARADHTSITRERNLFPSNNTAFLRISTRADVNHQHRNYMYGYYSDFENLANPQLQSFGSSSTSTQGRASQKGSANPLHHNYQRPSASNISPGDHSFLAASGFVPVMPYGGEHFSALGRTADDVLLSGYVARPQLGFQYSQMTCHDTSGIGNSNAGTVQRRPGN